MGDTTMPRSAAASVATAISDISASQVGRWYASRFRSRHDVEQATELPATMLHRSSAVVPLFVDAPHAAHMRGEVAFLDELGDDRLHVLVGTP